MPRGSAYFTSAGQTQRELKKQRSKVAPISVVVAVCCISVAVHVVSQFWIPAPVKPAFAAPLSPALPPPTAGQVGGNAANSRDERNRPFLIEDVTIVTPGEEPQYSHRRSLLIRNGLIERIFDSTNYTDLALRVPPNALRTKYENYFLLPPLVDLHSHLPPNNLLKLIPYINLLYLAYGVTTIRDAGDVDGTAIEAARGGVFGNFYPSPRIFACGPFVGGANPRWANSIQLIDSREAEAVVLDLKAKGYDCVKSYDGLNAETIAALKKAARKYDMHVIGHVPTALTFEEASLPETQHFLGIPDPKDIPRDHMVDRSISWSKVEIERLDEVVKFSLEHGLAHTPTLAVLSNLLHYRDYANFAKADNYATRLAPPFYVDVVWHPEEGLPLYRNLTDDHFDKIRESLLLKRNLLHRLYLAGADIYVGTDLQQPFVVAGVGVHQEMAQWLEAGVPRGAIWNIASVKAAQLIARSANSKSINPRLASAFSRLGYVEEGAPADFLLYRSDPLVSMPDGDKAWKPSATVSKGIMYRAEDMDRQIKQWHTFFRSTIWNFVSRYAARSVLASVVKKNN